MSDTSFFIKPKDNFLTQQEFTQVLEISNSGFNSLYRAKRNGKWWLLKALKKELQGDVMYQSLLMKEFDLMTSLQHPYIVQVYSIEDVKGIGNAIVMEWIEGVTLCEWLEQKQSANAEILQTCLLIRLNIFIRFKFSIAILNRKTLWWYRVVRILNLLILA